LDDGISNKIKRTEINQGFDAMKAGTALRAVIDADIA
jgi:Zn-dependent alcohol dehydrogenase